MQTQENTIEFSYNWNNKLSCSAFTTIRLYNPDKYQIGQLYDIFLKGKALTRGIIIDIKNFKLADINSFIAMLDTGYTVDECRTILQRMYPKVDFTRQLISLILIKKIDSKPAITN